MMHDTYYAELARLLAAQVPQDAIPPERLVLCSAEGVVIQDQVGRLGTLPDGARVGMVDVVLESVTPYPPETDGKVPKLYRHDYSLTLIVAQAQGDGETGIVEVQQELIRIGRQAVDDFLTDLEEHDFTAVAGVVFIGGAWTGVTYPWTGLFGDLGIARILHAAVTATVTLQEKSE